MSESVSTSYEVDVVKKYYGGTVTVAGRNLITSLIAGETIEFTRIVVGSGKMPDDVEPIDMEDLIQPVAEATSNVPTVENGILSMIIEYRNDMNGGLKEGFWLSEFGIYARTEKTEEVLLYYATLGNSPQPVSAYKTVVLTCAGIRFQLPWSWMRMYRCHTIPVRSSQPRMLN